MNPYDVLGLPREATQGQIKSQYRTLSKTMHPDKNKGEVTQGWRDLSLSYEVLSDAARRKRFDATGRTDETKVTPARIQAFLESTFRSVIEAKRKDGSTDDPTRENILMKILATIRETRPLVQQNHFEAQRKLERATRIKENFICKGGGDDIVALILQAEIDRCKNEAKSHEDAMELSCEVEMVLKQYTYKAGPAAEGQHTTGPDHPFRGSVNDQRLRLGRGPLPAGLDRFE